MADVATTETTGSTETTTTEETAIDLTDLDSITSVEKLKEVVAKERQLARDADKRASTTEPAGAKALQRANREAETLRLKLKEFEDRDKTDAQKLVEERDALKADNAKLQIETLRRDVAAAKGLDPKAIARLQGSTREEMEADADELLTLLKPGRAPFGEVNQGTRNAGGGRVYSTSELNDHAFFVANKADILLAQKEGRITD